MKHYPKVSIVTPSFNQDKFLEDTIKSVLRQNYPNLEYIIIDGGSSDNSVNIIKKYEHNLTYWISEKDSGQSEAINKGFQIATGKYINWLNSDDVLLPEAINKIVDYLEIHPDIDIVYGNTIMIDENGKEIVKRYEIEYDNSITLYGINYLPQPSALIRKSALLQVGLLNPDIHYCMDHELWLRLYSKGFRFSFVNNFVSCYRVHSQAKGFSGMNKLIEKERLKLKRTFGLAIKNRILEYIVYRSFWVYYRLKRKILQFMYHRKINVIPFSTRVKYYLFLL